MLGRRAFVSAAVWARRALRLVSLAGRMVLMVSMELRLDAGDWFCLADELGEGSSVDGAVVGSGDVGGLGFEKYGDRAWAVS